MVKILMRLAGSRISGGLQAAPGSGFRQSIHQFGPPQELIQQFLDHVRDYQAMHPEADDPRKIFEAWTIQKIAGLQYAVLHLADKVNELAEQIRQN